MAGHGSQEGSKPPGSRAEARPSGAIPELTPDERALLYEFAERLRARKVRNPVARQALDRAADELSRAASTSSSEDT